jgi:DNA polymerase sigma
MLGKYYSREKTQQRLKEHLFYFSEHCEDDWFGIFLFGSQNQGLNHEGSDVDSRVISIPKGTSARY